MRKWFWLIVGCATLCAAPVLRAQTTGIGLDDPIAFEVTGVPVGTPFCYDDPACTVYCEYDAGALKCWAAGAYWRFGSGVFLSQLGMNSPRYVLGANNNNDGGIHYIISNGIVGTLSGNVGNEAFYFVTRANSLGGKYPSTHPAHTDPTFYLMSDADVTVDDTEYMRMSHVGDRAKVELGKGAWELTADGFGCPQSTTQTLLAADQISADSCLVAVEGSGAARTLTSNPQIAAGIDGQRIVVMGVNETNTLTIVHGNGLRLNVATLTLGQGDTVELMYSSTITAWVQLGDASDAIFP